MVEIKLECCEGVEKYPGHCLKTRCPIYRDAKESIGHMLKQGLGTFGAIHLMRFI